MARSVASARRSQLVSTYGVGALFPSMDESFMICGLEDWPSTLPEVPEPRLARSLGVDTFRAPSSSPERRKDVPVVRFPMWHFCPGCRRLARLTDFCSYNEHRCPDCQLPLTPSRFVACCPRGHIEDFPYFAWVHNTARANGPDLIEGADGSTAVGVHRMSLRARGRSSSLGDIEVSCSCGVAPRSMAGSFGAHALRGIARCRGKRPWLRGVDDEECAEPLRTLQRGSSNVWFASVRSAISIPPWSEAVHHYVSRMWDVLAVVPEDALERTVLAMAPTAGLPGPLLLDAVRERRGLDAAGPPTEDELRHQEYQALVLGRPEQSSSQQFVCDLIEPRDDIADLVTSIAGVARLREVRALTGFSRVVPPDSQDREAAALSASAVGWLPAIEVLGEGVFVRLDEDQMREWEMTPFAEQRSDHVNRAIDLSEPRPNYVVTARLLLLHSLAHTLINEMSLDAGYPAASLRERVYCAPGQAGVLIYTATADSAGSLGGLAALSRRDLFGGLLRSAIRRSLWCSSDPVCLESVGTGAGALNLAACHACLLVPETSCELFNRFLDRATLVGHPDDPEGGYFSSLTHGSGM